MLRVVLIGSECTGKTTLAAELARRYRTVWVPESARVYAEAKHSPLGYEDVEGIASHHIAAAQAALPLASRLLILDSDLLATVLYSRHYYGDCPAWVERAARERLADLYLLHHPDVPWLPDPVRDRGHRRQEVHALFRDALAGLGARVADARGGWEERRERAVRAIEAILAEPLDPEPTPRAGFG